MIHECGSERFAVCHDELAAGVVVDYLVRNDCPAHAVWTSGDATANSPVGGTWNESAARSALNYCEVKRECIGGSEIPR